MPRILGLLLVLIALTPSLAAAAEERLVIYTAYEENELKDFWEQFKKDLPDLAAKASYIRASTGPIMARIEAEKANPQADVIWGVFNDYLTSAANKGLLETYTAKDSGSVGPTFRHPQNLWEGVTLLTVALDVNQKKMQDLKLTPPRSWEDLLDPKYKAHIVMANPSTSGTAYLLLASHVKRLGEDKAFEYYDKLDKNLAQGTNPGGAPGPMAAAAKTPTAISLPSESTWAGSQ